MDPFPAGPAGTTGFGRNSAAKNPGGRRSKPGRRPAKEEYPRRFFRQQRGVLPATAPLSIKTYWRSKRGGALTELKGDPSCKATNTMPISYNTTYNTRYNKL